LHEANAERARRFPEAMLTTMTHDTKRSSDVRARITALTWMADEWARAVRSWLSATEELRSAEGAPDDLERYFLFQTLAGAWPIEPERIEGYMEKALREAKRNTNWVDQNAEWEDAVLGFCRALYSHDEFLADFEPFVERLTRLGQTIALRALALKLTSPGVPDIYQGDELELRALVDPDNRRPVDWQWYEAMLARLEGGSPPDAHTRKLWLTKRLLGLRLRRQDAFGPAGSYEPLEAGPDALAFVRGGEVVVAVATRASVPSGSLSVPAGTWQDVLRGGSVGSWALSDLLDEHGIAVLKRARS
jgi:(1->4)-alpha-D-glucan 1-alpha-D-glucosylmutase